MPKVSVVMPAYNSEATIQASIQSVLAQTYTDFELLVVDDGSRDETAARVAQIDDARIRLLTHAENKGISPARNTALNAALGDYIASLDSDDVAHPTRLAQQVAFLDANPDVGILGSALERIVFQGNTWETDTVLRFPLHHNQIIWHMVTRGAGMGIVQPTTMLRRQVIEVVGLYDETCYFGEEDHDLYMRAIGHTRFANLPDPLITYQRLASSISVARSQQQQAAKCRIHIGFAQRVFGDDVDLQAVSNLCALYTPTMSSTLRLTETDIESVLMLLLNYRGKLLELGWFDADALGFLPQDIATIITTAYGQTIYRRDYIAPNALRYRYWQAVLPKPIFALLRHIQSAFRP